MKLLGSLLAASAMLVGAAAPVLADPPIPPPYVPPAETPPEAPAGPVPDGPKQASVAIALSTIGTLAPIGLIAAGAVTDGKAGEALIWTGLVGSLVGPSLGHLYAEDYWSLGLGLRVGGVLLFSGALAAAFSNLEDSDSGATALGWFSAGVYAAGTLYDVATADSAARDFNRAYHLSIAPSVIGTGSSQTVGVGLSGAF